MSAIDKLYAPDGSVIIYLDLYSVEELEDFKEQIDMQIKSRADYIEELQKTNTDNRGKE